MAGQIVSHTIELGTTFCLASNVGPFWTQKDNAKAGRSWVTRLPETWSTGPVYGREVDWIASSAPFEGVDLVADDGPRLGGKEPSNDYYCSSRTNKMGTQY